MPYGVDNERFSTGGVGGKGGRADGRAAPHAFIGKQVWFYQMVEAADTLFQRALK